MGGLGINGIIEIFYIFPSSQKLQCGPGHREFRDEQRHNHEAQTIKKTANPPIVNARNIRMYGSPCAGKQS
jgi:hypothetical protein